MEAVDLCETLVNKCKNYIAGNNKFHCQDREIGKSNTEADPHPFTPHPDFLTFFLNSPVYILTKNPVYL
jgi:hypothetical protein